MNKNIREYINLIDQIIINEAVNLHKNDHGIDDIVIWLGKSNKRHGMSVKISNFKNKWREDNNFTIKIPSLDYDPKQVASWITTDTIQKILQWIKINQNIIYDFENDKIMYSNDLISKLSKI